jgi:DNA-binding transcriptional LysR family regulator
VLQLFETFCAVAQTGSISKAAETLHISQPAVTRQIKALEQELGAVLLTRTSHGVAMTPVGRQVLGHMKQALGAVAACRRSVAESSPSGPARLSVAAGSMLTQFVISPVLAAFKASRPDLKVTLHTGHFQECLDRLNAYEVDLALISTPMIPSGLKAKPLFTDPMVVAVYAGSPLASGAADLGLADLEGTTLLVLPRATGLRQQITKMLADAGVNCQLVEHPSVETIKTMVMLDMGATLLPRSTVEGEAALGRLAAIPLRDWPDHGRPVLAVTRSEGALPEPVSAFLKALRERYGSDK